ncbi:hypothetical protein AGMMS50267_08790 [Spirochaetia bacterium]|nr:hypothetical protein AGMMS50267_08790 [Spirochaetia bacterium]
MIIMKEEVEDISGKKVFFLYPHSITQGELFDILIMAGFEVYALNDHQRARQVLARFPLSIMFINIDEKLEEHDWELYIRDILQNEKTRTARLGIMSYNMDPLLVEKYLMDMSLPCGYIQLKLGLQDSTKIILAALAANEAHDKRKHIRAPCENDPNTTMNYKAGDNMYYGKLLDISAAGFSVKVSGFEAMKAGTELQKVQIRLRTSLVMTDVILKGRRGDVYIFFFTNMNTAARMSVHRFIKQTIQRNIDSLTLSTPN